MKRFLRHPLVNRILAALIAVYGHFVFATCRIRYVGPLPADLTATPVIFAIWHQQLCAMPLLAKVSPYPLLGLMSASRDGTLTRAIARYFGIGAIIGSSSKGAVSATRSLIRASRGGNSLFLTPDGPRGPAGTAKQGTTEIARLTSLPVIPCAGWPISGHTFASWDSFRFPYPFTTYLLAYGEPLTTNTPEALTKALHALTTQAQAAAGGLASKAANA